MANIPYQHTPVMTEQVLEYLAPAAGKTLVDCTLGGGGHAQALLGKFKIQNPNIKIIGFDQDREAIEAAKKRLAGLKDIEYINANFSDLKQHINYQVDGILFDLGVSSYQIDAAERGFSLQNDGPLDMRMDRQAEITAADILNRYPAGELEKIFREFGEERFARRIANAVVQRRPLSSTSQLRAIVESAIPTWKKRESVTRIFQALRIAVNNELERLKKALNDGIELLRPGGRMVVISYHSLEDRIVKRAFREAAANGILKIMTRKPVQPDEKEREENPRARSAKLRAAEKI